MRRAWWHASNWIFSTRTFYVLEYRQTEIAHLPHASAKVGIRQLTNFAAIQQLQQAGINTSYLDTALSRQRILAGSVAWLVIQNDEVAFTCWVSCNSKQGIDILGPFLRLEEAWYIGDCYTSPRYRGRGLYHAALLEITHAARAQGKRVYIAVEKGHEVSLRAVKACGFQFCQIVNVKAVLGHRRFSAERILLAAPLASDTIPPLPEE
ncbi:MAG: GNAT family N-acetyltransferase [Formivibrio sp.]|nr:GNAT family N-acetyltransferase [Formivibrio sp.]